MKKTIIYVFLIFVIGLAGCSLSDTYVKDLFEDSLEINEDGSITEVITDVFDKDYYTIESLKAMVEDEISQKAISLESCELRDTDGVVSLVLKYDNYNVYNEFSEKSIFYGTIDEALLSGKLKNVKAIDVKKNVEVSIDSGFAQSNKDYKILITKDNMNLYTFGEVLYTDEYVVYEKKQHKCQFEESKQNHIIIFK